MRKPKYRMAYLKGFGFVGQWVNRNVLYPKPHTGNKQVAKNRMRNPDGLEFPRGYRVWMPHPKHFETV